jgi:protein-S-isoprenylcysteine O-methyltransferase Ste14
MFVFIRAVTYATLFIGLALVFLPAQLVSSPGLARPATIGAPQVVGMVGAVIGGALALWCILTFVVVGRGTPAPFDPPQRLVVRGPYAVVRNPMYIGAGLALASASLYYQSLPLLTYTAGFLFVMHLFVVLYEEPTLRRTFGKDYESYCGQVRRWLPRR